MVVTGIPLIACLFLSACGIAAFECTDSIGCVDIPPGEPIHIAYTLAISNSNATLGMDARNGAEIAIHEVGGIWFDHPIKFDGEDDHCSTDGGQVAGQRLAVDSSIVAVLGSTCSNAVYAAVPPLSRAGFTIISPLTTKIDLSLSVNENQIPGFLQVSSSDFAQGVAAAQFAWQELGMKRAATIDDGSPESEQLQHAFADGFTRLGGVITGQASIDPDQIDMSSILTSIAAGQPELIYHPVLIQAGSQIVKQVKQTSGLENISIMGAESMFSPEVVQRTGEAVEGLYVSSPDFTAYAEAYQSQFLFQYEELFGSTPIGTSHAYAYDAINLILAAINKVAVMDPDGTLHIGRQALREAVYATKHFSGLTGELNCTTQGSCAEPQFAIYQYHVGQYPPERVWP